MNDSLPSSHNKTTVPKVHAIFYNNPDTYPPIINSSFLIQEAGFDLQISCRDNGQTWNVLYPAGLRLRRIDTRSESSLREYAGFFSRVLRRGRMHASLFVGHDMHGFLVARVLSFLYRKPLIYHCHDYVTNEDTLTISVLGVKLVRAFEQRFARTSDAVIVPDAERAKVMERELRLAHPPIIVANAPRLRPLVVNEKLRAALWERGYEFDKIVFRQGRVAYGHAIEATLRSMPLWENPKWGFVVMGLCDEEFRIQLETLARELNVETRFVILPPVSYDEVALYTGGADLGHALYQPIHSNHATATTSSNKIMEYFASGVAVLASDTPSLRSLMAQYECGVTADESSPQSIARAINSLLSAPQRTRHLGDNGRRAFETRFCYERQFAPVIEKMRALTQKSNSHHDR